MRFVEAVDLVDEEDRPFAGATCCGLVQDSPDVLHTCTHRAELDEGCFRGSGNEAGKGGLAAAGRTPEDHGRESVLADQDTERFAFTEEVLLSGKLIEGVRPDAFRKRYIVPPVLVRGIRAKEVHYRDGVVL